MNQARLRWTIAPLIAVLGFETPAIAQIIPDDTLGSERSTVLQDATLNGAPLTITIDGVANPVDVIIDGARRGRNLFHSFLEFNAAVDRAIYFIAPDAQVQTILARVTGSNPSNIFGRLGTAQLIGDRLGISNASLFLINPNGILFGDKASLDVDGAFVATTANAVQFGNDRFSATTPTAVPDVLQVNPSAFLFNRIPTGDITVRSTAPTAIGRFLGLRVPNNQTLMLLGGNVNVEGGQLNAFGGRVEIGAVAGTGVVGLNPNGSLSIPEEVARAEVSFSQAARVDVALRERGDIGITANNIRLSDGSRLIAGVELLGGSPDSQAGDITLNATGTIDLTEASRIQNDVNPDRTGNSGDINLTTGSLVMSGQSAISANSFGSGDAGNVTIRARDRVSLTNGNTAIFTNVEEGAKGNGGNLYISANRLELRDGGQLIATLSGEGKAGNVTIENADLVLLQGEDANLSSSIFSRINEKGVGEGGNISISANRLELIDGGTLNASSLGQGNAGNVTIQVRDRVFLSGVSPSGVRSAIFSSIASEAEGQGGNLFLSTQTLELRDGSRLNASTTGVGNAGNVRVEVRDRASLSDSFMFSSVERGAIGDGGDLFLSANILELQNGAQLVASTNGNGNAGDVTVAVRDRVLISGRTPETTPGDRLVSGIFTSVAANGEGQGGNLFLSANTLALSNGAALVGATAGIGDAGNVTVDVRDRVSLVDGSNFFSSVETTGNGKGGNISVFANTLELTNQSQLVAGTSGIGNAGNVIVDVRDRVFLSGEGSSLFSSANFNAEGRGGDLNVFADRLELTDGAQLIANTQGQETAGNIFLGTRDRPIRSISISGTTPITGRSSALFAFTDAAGTGGNIRIFADRFRLTDGGVVDARTLRSGESGTITLNANTIEILGGGQILAVTEGSGRANSITINARDQLLISGTDPTYTDRVAQFGSVVAPIIPESGIYTRSRGSENAGRAGSISLTAPRIELDDRARIDAQSATVDGGNITIRAIDRLLLRNNSQITATAGTAEGFGDGGNINIDARFIIAIPKENSDITANAFRGSGGRVTLNVTGGVLGIEARSTQTELSDITASSAQGTTGIVTLNTPDTTSLQNSLTQLSQTEINTNELLANSCLVRDRQNGSFYITGAGGLPTKPTELSDYPTGTIQRPIPTDRTLSIAEPQGIYQLPNGTLVMIRECSN